MVFFFLSVADERTCFLDGQKADIAPPPGQRPEQRESQPWPPGGPLPSLATATRSRWVLTWSSSCAQITETAHFANDLGLDSLDTVEVVMAIEEVWCPFLLHLRSCAAGQHGHRGQLLLRSRWNTLEMSLTVATGVQHRDPRQGCRHHSQRYVTRPAAEPLPRRAAQTLTAPCFQQSTRPSSTFSANPTRARCVPVFALLYHIILSRP